jgi:hypothetical protein
MTLHFEQIGFTDDLTFMTKRLQTQVASGQVAEDYLVTSLATCYVPLVGFLFT